MKPPIPSEFPERLRHFLEDVPLPLGKIVYLVYDRAGQILYDLNYETYFFSVTVGTQRLTGYKISDLLRPRVKDQTVENLLIAMCPPSGSVSIQALLLPFLNKPWNSKSDVHNFFKGMPAYIGVTSFGEYFLAALHIQDYYMDRSKGQLSQDMMVILDENDEMLFACHAFATNMKLTPADPKHFIHELTMSEEWRTLLNREKVAREYLFSLGLETDKDWQLQSTLSSLPTAKWLFELNSRWEISDGKLRSVTPMYNGFITCLEGFEQMGRDIRITFKSRLTEISGLVNAIGVVFHQNIFHALESPDQGAYNFSLRSASSLVHDKPISVVLKKSGTVIDEQSVPFKNTPYNNQEPWVLFGFERVGGAFSLYVNGEKMATLIDTSPLFLPFHDRIGFLASEGTQISDIKLYQRPTIYEVKRMPPETVDLQFYPLPGFTFETRIGKYTGASENHLRYVYMKDVTYSRQLLEKLNSHLHSIEQELDTANKIEAVLANIPLPKSPNVDFAYSHKSSSKVGGDLFDIKVMGSEKYIVLIYDVSGHGIAASLVSSMAKMSFENAFKQTQSPAAIMELVNRDICIVADASMFITAFLCVIDITQGKITYSRAGHCPPVLFSQTRTTSPIFLKDGSPLIGNRPDFEYKEYSESLQPGDRILLYTDGIIELRNQSDDLFGKPRLFKILSSTLSKNVVETKASILKEAEAFANGRSFEDDITFILIDIKKTGKQQ